MKSPCLLLHLWLFCIIVIFAFFFFDEVRGQCLEHQKSLLLKFKRSLVINKSPFLVKSAKLENWNSSIDCCLWPGLTCSGTYVTGLDLSNEGIVGGLNDSSSLFQLTSLDSLNLAMMYQETIIPSGIGRLVNLINLNMSGSHFIGQIPIQISNLTRLVSLHFSNCYYLKVENPNLRMLVGNLSNLIDLRLSHVDLSSQSKEWCQALSSSTPRLQVLDLSYCLLSRPIHDSLQNLTHLSTVDISSNNFSSPVPYEVFASLEDLTSLNLRFCEFYGVFPHTMLQFPALLFLDLSVNHLLEPSASITFQNSSLETLLLYGTNFSKTIPESIGEARMLSNLDLGACNLSGQIPKSISRLERLVYLDLWSNNLDGHIPSFSRSRNLTVLDLSYNHLSGSILATDWKKLPWMTSLLLSSNSLSGSIPTCLFETPSLVKLGLDGNHFTGFTNEYNIMSSLSGLLELNLHGNDLQGSFPPFIDRLNNLRFLDISFNDLKGSILATDWKKLPQMVSLILRSNSLSGSIPTSLFETPSLLMLDLEGNRFTGFTDESNVTASSSHLLELYLRDNDLKGSFPAFIYELNSLQILDLSFNNLTDTFCVDSLQHLRNISHNKLTRKTGNDFPYFPQLNSLGLSSCSLKEFPYFLTNQSRLRNLDLSYNQIDGHIPDQIWNMTSLLNLNVSHNRLEILGCIEVRSGFEILDLSFNKLHGKLPSIPQSMYYLDLSRNLFNSIIPVTIGFSLTYMRLFSLSSNNLHGSIPESICNATFLQVIDFSNNFLSDTLPHCVTQMPNLAVLNLRKNNLCGFIPDALPSPCVLQTLDLSHNSFQGKIPNSLEGCSSLEALDLGYNKLHDRFPCWVNNIGRLIVLVLRSNSLYGSIQCLNHNSNWSRLQIIDIASNDFGGKLPSQGLLSWEAMLVYKNSTSETGGLHYQRNYPRWMTYNVYGKFNYLPLYFENTVSVIVKGHQWNLTKIATIFTLVDFSDNKFKGDIPYELGELKFLYALNMSHNYLTGRIPPSFGNLNHIESLDLSKNELSGKIPGELAVLTFLSFLNLSFNHLEGMVPKGRQFQTFSEASFKGNKGLCGEPLSTSCGNKGVSTPPNPLSEAEDEFRVFIATEIGYALGFGLVIIPLLFWSRWRMTYYECIDKVLMSIFCYQLKKPATASG